MLCNFSKQAFALRTAFCALQFPPCELAASLPELVNGRGFVFELAGGLDRRK
jgi:hypothetical protein